MPLPDPRPLTREEFEQIQNRLDYINAHAENDGAGYSTANTVEILDHANRLYAAMVYYLLRWAETREKKEPLPALLEDPTIAQIEETR